MICRTVIGRQFAGVIKYQFAGHEHKQTDKRATLLAAAGVRTDSVDEMIADFTRGSQGKPSLGKPVWHTSLSFNPDDAVRLNDRVMREVARRFMEKMDLDKTQYIIVRHRDRPGHEHMHIVANRVADDGHTIPDNHSRYRSLRALREVIAEFGLTPPNGHRTERQNPEQMQPVDRVRHTLRNVLAQQLSTATQTEELDQNLRKRGIDWQLVYAKQGQVIMGCRFTLDGITVSGSALGSAFTLPAITARLEQNKSQDVEQRQQVIEQKWQTSYAQHIQSLQKKNESIHWYNTHLRTATDRLNGPEPALERLQQAADALNKLVYYEIHKALAEDIKRQQRHTDQVLAFQQERQALERTARGVLGIQIGRKVREAQTKLSLCDHPHAARTPEEQIWAERVRQAKAPEPAIETKPMEWLKPLLPEPSLSAYAADKEEESLHQRRVLISYPRGGDEQQHLTSLRNFLDHFQVTEGMQGDKPQVAFLYDVRDPRAGEMCHELYCLGKYSHVQLTYTSEAHKQEASSQANAYHQQIPAQASYSWGKVMQTDQGMNK